MQPRFSHCVVTTLFATLLASAVSAQSVLFSREGDFVDDEYGATIANAGDVNADGYDDVITGAPLWDGKRGKVEILSGIDGSVLHDWSPDPGHMDQYGLAVTGVGDANMNGYADVAFTVLHPTDPTLTMILVRDGLTATNLYAFFGSWANRFGYALAGGGDSDGDTFPELLVGEPGYINNLPSIVGRVHRWEFNGGIVSPTTVEGLGSESDFGQALAWIGDTDGDGDDEFLIGSPGYASGAGLDVGRVYCYDAGFQSLWTRTGVQAGGFYGFAITGGDFNGNGLADVAVGGYAQVSVRGLVQTLGGMAGGIISTRLGDSPGDRFGYSLASLDDIDGDGVDDLAVGAPNDGETTGFSFSEPGVIHIVSGANLSPIRFRRGFASWGLLGRTVVSLRDVTGDGHRDLATSATFTELGAIPQSSEPGTLYLMDSVTNSAACNAYGAGTAGTLGVPTLTCTAPPRIGTTTTLELSNSSGSNELCAYFAGRVDAFAPFMGGNLYVVPTIIEYSASVAGSGSSLLLAVPQMHTLSGQRWIVQGLQVDAGAPQGVSFSRPLEILFGGF